MHSILEDIIRGRQQRVLKKKESHPADELVAKTETAQPLRDFAGSIRGKDRLHLIAEIKKASPSAGVINQSLKPVTAAQAYEKAGAHAISYITEDVYFKGNIYFVPELKHAVSLPLIMKDFIVDEYQIYEARVFGADAILLIARILPEDKLRAFYELAYRLGMDAVIEVHSEEELSKTLDVCPEAAIIGINNRDLETFAVDKSTLLRIAPKVPSDKVLIAESGFSSPGDIETARTLHCDAVLVGESLMRAGDIARTIKEWGF